MAEENLRTFENEEYRHTYWHSCSHIMAQAVKRLFPEAKIERGLSILGHEAANSQAKVAAWAKKFA